MAGHLNALSRRRFLAAAGAAGALRRPPPAAAAQAERKPFPVQFAATPSFEKLRPLIDPANDEFASEKRAAAAASILDALIETRRLPLAEGFRGADPNPAAWDPAAEDAETARYAARTLDADAFPAALARWIDSLGEVEAARFFPLAADRVRCEIASRAGGRFEYRVGHWRIAWRGLRAESFEPLDETRVFAPRKLFEDATAGLFGAAESFRGQLSRGVPYWRSRLDSACGIDVYGQNGIAVGDIDNDGFDEIYVCQPGGLPNRLYRRGPGGAMRDVTEEAGVGLLDNCSSAIFADFRNAGLQDLVVVAGRPLYFLNRGGGRFALKPDAFRFAKPPRGAFTGMAAADYDGDGRVDLYLCAYIYFQSEDQYNYPAPYHDSTGGPPNFLFRNRLAADGSGSFEDATAAAGLDDGNDRYSFAAAWCDYDGDSRPELYVANDFGRNNLYKFDGGRFRDVAAESGVQDLGPGMSASWLDYDGDGRPDLFVTNMWTAAGQRIAADPSFALVANHGLGEEFRRHAKGNSLYRNRGGGAFEETGAQEQIEMGRWSWAGEGIDFDCDGAPELYIAAGMLTNGSREDLESFFWRRVAARSAPDATPSKAYEEGWNALNQFVREDKSWNGREPNVFYARRGGRYFDFSGVSGLDFAEDSRSFAATDLDGDGRLDLLLKSRLAPQVRALRNRSFGGNHALALSLRGVRSNRDAIGAWVTLAFDGGSASQGLNAGSGYLCQHTKRLHFGLGKARRAKATVRWPSGAVETIDDLEAEFLYEIVEGSGVVSKRPFAPRPWPRAKAPAAAVNEETFEPAWLLDPLPLPEKRPGPGFVCLAAGEHPPPPAAVPWQVVDLRAEEPQTAAWYALFRRYVFDYRAGLSLPLTLLIDADSRALKLYPGLPAAGDAARDLAAAGGGGAAARALPFPGFYAEPPARNYFRHGAAFFGAGYPRQALPYLEEVLRRDPENFKTLLAVGQIHLQAKKLPESKAHLERALRLRRDSPQLWNNLGGLALEEGNDAAALERFAEALAIDPDFSFALANAGLAHERLGDAAAAERMYRKALAIDPQDSDTADRLGLLLAKQGRLEKAKTLFQQAIEAERGNASAINNLAVLYMRMGLPDEARAALRYGLRAAPREEMLYINLARILVRAGDRERARGVLRQLLDAVPGSEAGRRALEELTRP